MKQGNDTIKIKDLVSTYKLDNHIPEDYKQFISESMAANYKRLMKRAGIYSVISGIFISIYFFFKKTVIGTFISNYVLYILLAIAVSGSGIVVYLYMDSKKLQAPEPIKQKIDSGGGNKISSVKKPAPLPVVITYTIGIMGFQSNTLIMSKDNPMATLHTQIMHELNRIGGTEYATVIGSASLQKSKYLLTGSVEKLANSYVLFVKVLDKNNSILYVANKKAGSIEDIASASKEFARIIVGNIK